MDYQCPEVIDSDNEHLYESAKAHRKRAKAAPSLLSADRHLAKSTDAIHSDENSLEVRWPTHAQLRGYNLKEQHELIRKVCRDAIKIVQTTLVMQHAWPELNRLAEYRREVLTTATQTLLKVDDRYTDIRERVKKDDKFAMVLGKLVSAFCPQSPMFIDISYR